VKEFLSEFINAVCEVRNMENEMLITGRVRKVLEVEDNSEDGSLAIEIVALSGEPLPSAVYDLPVKINLFSNSSGYHTIGGHVYIANPVFWRINKVSKLSDIEKRDFFRVRVCSSGKVYSQKSAKPDEDTTPVPINVLDISLSGILFKAEASFQINDLLYIFDVQLCDQTPLFSTLCTVRRIDSGPRSGILYGCSFESLSEKEEDTLFSMIFNLQRLEIQKRRKRL